MRQFVPRRSISLHLFKILDPPLDMTKGTLIESNFDENLPLKQNNVTTDTLTGHHELHAYLSDI